MVKTEIEQKYSQGRVSKILVIHRNLTAMLKKLLSLQGISFKSYDIP